jgi:Ca2+-binding EF-hand superfamily protein
MKVFVVVCHRNLGKPIFINISEKDLLTMVRDVSEDHIYDTIEFNEFLQMMSKQQKFGMTEDSLKDAFR